MPESSTSASQQRRANWVALRTLRQRPRPAGQTDSGEPIFEVRSVRLVLRADAAWFNRLEKCSRCKRDVPGQPIHGQSDLDRPSQGHICRACASSGIRPGRGPESRPVGSAAPAPPLPAEPAVKEKASPPAEPAGQGRLPPEPAVREKARPPAEPAGPGRLPPEPAVKEKARPPAEPAPRSRPPEAETQLPAARDRSTEVADARRSKPVQRRSADDPIRARFDAALAEALAGIRTEITTSSQAYAARVEALEEDVRESLSRVVERLQGQQSELTSLSGALVDTRSEIQRVSEAIGELARGQADLDKCVNDMVATRSAARVASGLGEVDDQLDVLARHIQEVDARIDALASTVEDGGDRLDALRLRTQESVDRLTGMVEAQRRELRLAAAGGPTTPPRDPPRGPPGPLLDGLERQLQEADRRLARLATTTPDGD